MTDVIGVVDHHHVPALERRRVDEALDLVRREELPQCRQHELGFVVARGGRRDVHHDAPGRNDAGVLDKDAVGIVVERGQHRDLEPGLPKRLDVLLVLLHRLLVHGLALVGEVRDAVDDGVRWAPDGCVGEVAGHGPSPRSVNRYAGLLLLCDNTKLFQRHVGRTASVVCGV